MGNCSAFSNEITMLRKDIDIEMSIKYPDGHDNIITTCIFPGALQYEPLTMLMEL